MRTLWRTDRALVGTAILMLPLLAFSLAGLGLEVDGPEEVYARVLNAVINRKPISAVYHRLYRLLCPHRLGWNRSRQPRVINTAEKVRVDLNRRAPQLTGAALQWRN